jgi:very-short-patch-repair endonuclease
MNFCKEKEKMSEYEYELFSDNGKVICQMCGNEYHVISPKHLLKHKVTHPEYRLRFPNAPLSSGDFGKISKYGKDKPMFEDQDKTIVSEMIGDETIVYDEPEVEEEFDLQKVIEFERRDPIQDSKHKVYDHLRMYFTNIKMDYSIRENWPDGRTIFEFITDFADPVLKINIEFPKVFWHNQDQYIDLNRDPKLEEHGWKVVKIKSVSPSNKQIDEAIKNL